MPRKVCFAYIWATSGGVERVFLNRSEALFKRYPDLAIDVFFYDDCGGLPLFLRYLQNRNLSARVRVVNAFNPALYDAVFSVDTPRLLSDYPSIQDKLFMECHTHYADNRTYLKDCQSRLKTLLVPSDSFRQLIARELPGLGEKVKVLRNFVPPFPDGVPSAVLPDWAPPVFLYFGRIDEHKNIKEFIEAIDYLRNHAKKDCLGIICGQVDPAYSLRDAIDQRRARGSVIVLPPVPFARSHALLQLMRKKRAVMVSCSKGESFGLSVAEAMTAGLPVVVSDIPPHATLVGKRPEFLYPLGNVRELALRMTAAAERYDELARESLSLARDFSEEAFLEDWEALFAPTRT